MRKILMMSIGRIFAVLLFCRSSFGSNSPDETAIKLLPAILGHVTGRKRGDLSEILYREFEDETKEGVLAAVKEAQRQPMLLKMIDGAGERLFVVVDQELMAVGAAMPEAIRRLVQCHYVFGLTYDARLGHVYRFLEALYGLQGINRLMTVMDTLEDIRGYEQ